MSRTIIKRISCKSKLRKGNGSKIRGVIYSADFGQSESGIGYVVLLMKENYEPIAQGRWYIFDEKSAVYKILNDLSEKIGDLSGGCFTYLNNGRWDYETGIYQRDLVKSNIDNFSI